MQGRTIGLALTGFAVLVLLVSLLVGLGGGEAPVAGRQAPPPERGMRVRVEVLNAAGVAGLARAATDRLRNRGFDVVYYGNAAEFGRDSSVVLDRVGDLDTARRVAEAAGVELVRSRPDSTRYVDVSVVLGRDWSGIERPDTADLAPSAEGAASP